VRFPAKSVSGLVRSNSRREIEDEDMARRPAKPWFRKDSQAWFICINGKQMNLGKDKKEAHRRFHGIMATNAPPKKEELSVHLAVKLKRQRSAAAHRAPSTGLAGEGPSGTIRSDQTVRCRECPDIPEGGAGVRHHYSHQQQKSGRAEGPQGQFPCDGFTGGVQWMVPLMRWRGKVLFQ
jgi:hypothetical protein